VIISCGHRGSGEAAAQLRRVLDGLKMHPTAAMPGITFREECSRTLVDLKSKH
jgi:hypothetical protein